MDRCPAIELPRITAWDRCSSGSGTAGAAREASGSWLGGSLLNRCPGAMAQVIKRLMSSLGAALRDRRRGYARFDRLGLRGGASLTRPE
jgi:hypothetical protein